MDMAKKINYDDWSKEELIKELRRIKETKYGLVWHRDLPAEKIDILINPDARTPNEMFPNEMAGKPFPVLKESKGKAIETDKSKPVNLLIEGDNYHSLAVLNFTHHEAIDLIYIDPPYNTGNKDFIYNDKFVDIEDPYRHSKWLSFMEKRLKLAKNLLKSDGVIFISINDIEQAPLKMLCDEIFGEENYISMISRLMKSGGNKGRFFSPNIEYILVYAKDVNCLKDFRLPLEEDYQVKIYSRIQMDGEKKGQRYREMGLYQAGLDTRPNQRYWIKCPDGTFVIPPGGSYPERMGEGAKAIPSSGDGVWRWIYSRYLDENKKGNILFKKTKTSSLINQKREKSNWNIYTKIWLENRVDSGRVPINYIGHYENRQSSQEMKELGIDFQFAKPVGLIKHLIKIANKNADIKVLDFMAGSGTTGQSVLEANREDGGNRQFILCTNNENDICSDVCYPRLKKVAKGYKNNKGKNIDGLGGNLKYYTCDFVEAEPTDRNKRKLVSESTEMLCIRENAFELVQDEGDFKLFKGNDKYLGIVFYEEAIDDFKKAIKKIKGHFNTYVFSLGDDPHEKQFADVKGRVTLCAIPEVILKVYREIFK
jgi:adenine-specific DNA-methyltransferase